MALIDQFHQKIAQKIEAGDAGNAQAVINDVKVSYDGEAFSYAYPPYDGLPPFMLQDQIYQSLVYAVAVDAGRATGHVFSESRIHQIVSDARAHNSSFTKKHQMADALEAFYLDDGASGAHMLK